jgi:hypothetical protein
MVIRPGSLHLSSRAIPSSGHPAAPRGGYLYRFDDQSPVSTFGVAGVYSDTDSYVAGVFANTYFGADRHRLVVGMATGRVRNDYEDFLGSGLPVQTTDDLRFAAARYLYRFRGDWFAGLQFVTTNYTISSDNWFSDKVLDLLGLTGFDSNGVGLVAQFDDRDNQNSPSSGQSFSVHNIAYRESLGGDESFDVYTADYRRYWSHGVGHVLAFRGKGRFTQGAPPAGYSRPAVLPAPDLTLGILATLPVQRPRTIARGKDSFRAGSSSKTPSHLISD